MALLDLLLTPKQLVLDARDEDRLFNADPITVDVTVEETHTRGAEIAKSPVEQGADIADHRRTKPWSLRIRGIVTDTSTGIGAALAGFAAATNTDAGGNQDSPSQEAYERLQMLFDAAEPFNVATEIHFYKNMVFTELTVHRDQKSLKAIEFEAALEEVRFALTDSVFVVTVPDAAASATPTKDVGQAHPPDVTPTGSHLTGALGGSGAVDDAINTWEHPFP